MKSQLDLKRKYLESVANKNFAKAREIKKQIIIPITGVKFIHNGEVFHQTTFSPNK